MLAASRKLLLVFVHGFCGSEASFGTFPEQMMKKLDDTNIEFKYFPRFETCRHNEWAVNQFISWLLLNATTVHYSRVILVAHSMGGLLCADAYAKLYGNTSSPMEEMASPPKENESGGWFEWLWPTLPCPNKTQAISEDETREWINIIGIVAFDSPFYGLSSSVLVGDGTYKAWSLLKETATEKLSAFTTQQASLQTESVSIEQESVSISTLSDQETSSTTQVASGITGVFLEATKSFHAVKKAASAASWVYQLKSPLSFQTLFSQSKKLVMPYNFGEFLYPILNESIKTMNQRVDSIIQDSKCHFTAFYLELTQPNSAARHFCHIPKESQVVHDHFIPITHQVFTDNVIDAHMNLFYSPSELEQQGLSLPLKQNDGAYEHMMDQFVKLVLQLTK